MNLVLHAGFRRYQLSSTEAILLLLDVTLTGSAWLEDSSGFHSEGKKCKVFASRITAYCLLTGWAKYEAERGAVRKNLKGFFLALSWPSLEVINGCWIWVSRGLINCTHSNHYQESIWLRRWRSKESSCFGSWDQITPFWVEGLVSSDRTEKLHKMLAHWLCNRILINKDCSMPVKSNGMRVKCFALGRSHYTKLHICEF